MARVWVVTDTGFSFASCMLEICQAQKHGSCPEACTIRKRRCRGKREGVTRCITFVFSSCFPRCRLYQSQSRWSPALGTKQPFSLCSWGCLEDLGVFHHQDSQVRNIVVSAGSVLTLCSVPSLAEARYGLRLNPAVIAVSTPQQRMCSGYFKLTSLSPASFWPELWCNFLGGLMDEHLVFGLRFNLWLGKKG